MKWETVAKKGVQIKNQAPRNQKPFAKHPFCWILLYVMAFQDHNSQYCPHKEIENSTLKIDDLPDTNICPSASI
jgi:hypothetical protein